jgi:hypothetical protein
MDRAGASVKVSVMSRSRFRIRVWLVFRPGLGPGFRPGLW